MDLDSKLEKEQEDLEEGFRTTWRRRSGRLGGGVQEDLEDLEEGVRRTWRRGSGGIL